MTNLHGIQLTIPDNFRRRGDGKKRDRLLVLGFDGMSFNVIHSFVKKGLLKNIQKIMENGTWGDLDCPPPTNSIVGWTSFMTGTNPGKHGIYNYGTFVERNDGTQHDFVMSDATIRGINPFWNILSEDGKKVVVVNVVGTYPPDLKDGIQISGGPLLPLDYGSYTFPPELTKDLERYGYSAAFPLYRALETKGRLRIVNDVFSVSKYLVTETDWDCLVAVFEEPDKTHSLSGEGLELERMYCRLDQIIGELIEAAGDGTHVVICSDHGNGPYRKSVHLERWLYQNNWLHLSTDHKSLKKVKRESWVDEGAKGWATYVLFKLVKYLELKDWDIKGWPFLGRRLKNLA